MAVFTVLLMIAWAGGGGLSTFLNGPRAGSDPSMKASATAVEWNGGSLTNQQVYDMVTKRRLLNAFMQRVHDLGARTAYLAGVEPSQLRVQSLMGPETERNVVETRLFADAARKAGMRVSDEAIVQYLDQLGRGNVSREQMRKILESMQTRGGRVSIDEIMSGLRDEMLSHNYINSNQYAFHTVTPEQRWKDWLQVNERAVVEAAAIPTESYLVDVKEPTEAELQAFYEKYKNFEKGPDYEVAQRLNVELASPTPGFHIPRKIDVQFLEANYNTFLAKAEDKVTDEEIAKYYEEHKDPMFIKADTGLMEDAGEKKEVEKPEGDAATDAKDAGDSKPEEKPAEKAAETPADEAKTDEKAAPADTPAKEEGNADDTKEGKQSSLNAPSNSPFRLVAFLQDAAKEDGAAKDDTEKKDTPKPDAEATTESKSTEAAAPPAVGTPPATAAPVTGLPGLGLDPSAIIKTPPAPKKPPEFQPLDQVKDVIRRRLAEGKVADELNQLTSDIQGQLEGDYNKYYGQVLNAEADKKERPVPPKSLTNLAPLAEKYGLKSGTTGPLTALQFRDTPLGKSAAIDTNKSLLIMLYSGKELDMYQPVSTMDIDGNHFVVMKTSDTPAKVPPLAEVRDEVVKAWKAQQAAELALKHAQEDAKKAQDAKTPLATFFADNSAIKVVTTDPFSELTGGDVGFINGQFQRQPFRLSQPDKIVSAGPEFMKEVFKLKDGEVGAVLNHDHTIAYVVRMVEHQPSADELRTAYLAEANNWPGLDVKVQEHALEVAGNLRKDITDGSGLTWVRAADQDRSGQPTSGDEASDGG